MRIYTSPELAFNETIRDVAEMGIECHPATMQDKNVAGDEGYATKELVGYGFQVHGWGWSPSQERASAEIFWKDEKLDTVINYIDQEYQDRLACKSMNPGNAWAKRKEIWEEFIHPGLILHKGGERKPGFHYTYAERFAVQIPVILERLQRDPDTRQAVITMHSNINTDDRGRVDDSSDPRVYPSQDLENIGGVGRIPCSMYYQFIRRGDSVNLIYTMRSCDLFTHFPIDVLIALRLQNWMADRLGCDVGTFTYFAGSLHAYHKDITKEHRF